MDVNCDAIRFGGEVVWELRMVTRASSARLVASGVAVFRIKQSMCGGGSGRKKAASHRECGAARMQSNRLQTG